MGEVFPVATRTAVNIVSHGVTHHMPATPTFPGAAVLSHPPSGPCATSITQASQALVREKSRITLQNQAVIIYPGMHCADLPGFD